MTPPALTTTLRLAPAVLSVLLVACGDDPATTVTASASDSNTTPPATETSTPTSVSDSDNTPTTTGSASGMSQSGSSDGTDTSAEDTSATSVSTTASDTTNPETTNPETTNPETTNPETTNPETTNPIDTDTETTVDPDTTAGDDTTTSDDTTGGVVEPCKCADVEVPLDDGIFVLSDNAQLWKFFPADLSFTMLGSFSCNGNTSSFSMAVDRLGYAWVMFQDGSIGKVDVTNPNVCLPSGYNTNQMGVNLFGMGFVSNSQFDQCDSLFGNTFSGGGFSEGPNQGTFLNMKTEDLLIKKLGPTTFNGAEISGTGDGRVFMFGGVNPSKLVEVDRTNGAYIDVLPLNGVETTQGFAFAHFDGDFYIFTESGNFLDSKVTHVDYDDSDMNNMKDVSLAVPHAPIRIVGAGVSTCAPFAPQ